MGQIACDEDYRAVFTHRARKGEREAGQEGRQHRRQDDPPQNVQAPGAERFRRVLQIPLDLLQRRLHRAHGKGQADESQCDRDADPGIGHVHPERLQILADPTVVGEHRGERDA
jgi:hypothetical protein